MSRLKPSELLALRLERELQLPIVSGPWLLRPLGKYQKGMGVLSWMAETADGWTVTSEDTMGELLRANRIALLRQTESHKIEGEIHVSVS